MPLFPAYAPSDTLDIESDGETVVASSASAGTASPALEARLLASDDDGDADSAAAPRPAKRPSPTDDSDFYLDTKFDGANLPVTTLYYPGRPQYDLTCAWKVLGLDKSKGRRISRGKRKRYYSGEVPSDAAAVAAEVAARAQALRRALADDPADQPLWLRYIAFQERWAGGEAALRAADEAEAAAGAGAAGVRAAVLRVRARHLPRADYCAALRRRIAAEREPLALWVRLVRAAGGGGGGGGDGGEGAAALAARALRRLRHSPPAYPHLLYAYGCWARDAGLWELLTLLVELVLSVCLGADARLPPPPQERLDARLQAAEDKIIESGLPMHVVWARVERARAEAHWHRAGAGAGASAELDPQRAPHPADVADLLLPVADPDAALLLCAQLLRLAKVPLLPACGASARAAAPCADEPGGGEALLPLVAAARRLPAAHPARCGGAALAARSLARFVDPPHYFSDDNGYRRWVDALWDACCERTRGERRTALLCWRMRWWHALLLLVADEAEAEARRVLADARAALKRFEDASPLPFALFARVQLAAGAGAGAERARGVAVRALRSALADARCPPPHRLHVARVVGEADRADGPWGKWATACAALGRPLPPDAELEAPPPEELTQAALDECRRRCAQLERRFEAEAEGDGAAPPLHEALLPGAGEWASALVRLAAPAASSPLPPPARLAALVTHASAEAAGYWEQAACAWAVRAARAQRQARVAHALAPLFPRNAFLALAAGGAPPWAWRRPPEGEGEGVAGAPESPEAALAPLLPRLLRAERARWAPAEAGRVAAACAAACAGGGGPLAWCARLEAEGRGGGAGGGTRAALLGAAEAQPHHKWALARGAALCPAEAAALPDLLLERHLRLHALPDELRLPTATATATATPQ